MVKAKPRGKPAKYSVEAYLNLLTQAGRSEATTRGYFKVFQSFAKFLDVPVNEIHYHLSVDNLLKYAGSRNGTSPAGKKTALSVLHRYFEKNGVVFDELEYNAMKPKTIKEHNDKPLTLPVLQAMMDLTDAHGRSLLSFLISTGVRAGELTQIQLSDIGRIDGERFVPDINGDVINVRNEIAKGGHGGMVFLTAEAREYLTIWLRERDQYLEIADARMKGLVRAGAHHRQDKDDRIFGVAYTSLHKWFTRLYEKTDGEKGKYHNACTIHSCRKFFRTVAAQSMHPDLVTILMRQTGYLDSTYVRKTNADKREEFHAKEACLYITRADHRIQGSKLDQLQREKDALQARVQQLEKNQKAINTLDKIPLSEADKDDIARRMLALQKGREK